MLKTFLATAALATSAFVIGYHTDKISEIAGKAATEIATELTSLREFMTLDPETAFWSCYDENRWNISVCKPYAEAWKARDGQAAVIRKALPRMVADGVAAGLANKL